MQNLSKKLPHFRINDFDAYKFGESWIVLYNNKTKSFERLSLFIAWAAEETYKALSEPTRQPVYFTGLN